MALWKWLLLPLMAGVILMTYLWLGDLKDFPGDARTPRIIIWHVPMAILSMVWFAVAAFYSGRYLARQAEFDDTRASKAAEIGLLLTVLATVTGAIFSKMQWGGGFRSPWYMGYWQWDPKQTAIVVVIFVFMAYFGLRMSVDDPRTRARLSAVYAILGFVAVPVLYFVLPQMTQILGITMHPQNVITKGMDTPYRVTYNLALLGFIGITVWIYHLQLRIARLEGRRLFPDEAGEERRVVRKAGSGVIASPNGRLHDPAEHEPSQV
jgi:heme exporter protein C